MDRQTFSRNRPTIHNSVSFMDLQPSTSDQLANHSSEQLTESNPLLGPLEAPETESQTTGPVLNPRYILYALPALLLWYMALPCGDTAWLINFVMQYVCDPL